ncbi:MAG: putative rane protein [Actinomycetia bacterium]|nr:putative rane protein [Actinomycetes bacterium]
MTQPLPAQAAPAPAEAPSAPSAGTDPADGRLRGILEVATLVLAPTTVITALLFYFGWAQTSALFGRLGIDQSALGFTVQDYMLRSVNSTFRPLTVVLLASVAGLSIHIAVARALATPGRAGLADRLWPVSMVAGGLLMVAGLSGLWGLVRYRVDFPVVPLSLGTGLGLLAYGAHLRGQAPERREATAAVPRTLLAARRTVVAIFVLVMLFWSVAVYAQARGVREAARVAATISRRPDVTVYSAKRLHLEGPTIREAELGGPDAAYRFRYSGLKLVVRSGGKWFLLPTGWTPGNRGAALLLPDTNDLRVEFTSGR